MLCGAFSAKRQSTLGVKDGLQEFKKYIVVIEEHLLVYKDWIFEDSFIFHQNYAPIHESAEPKP